MSDMSTGHLPQAIGHHLLADGVDQAGRPVAGNVAIVTAVWITDPADLPTGTEPGLWGEVVRVEDPGGRTIRDTYEDDYSVDGPLTLDPPIVDEGPAGPGDLAPDVVELATAA
jgi:hypothetical protein